PRPPERRLLQRPLAVLEDEGAVVDDLHRRVQEDAVEVKRADVLPAGIRVVVVAEREVDGADPALLRGRSERCLLARAERELADDVGVLDAVDRLPQLLCLLAALDLHALAALERPRDRLLDLA